jgi:hypothetical protein
MSEGLRSSEKQTFSSPEEEVRYLREQIARREHELTSSGKESARDTVAHEVVREYMTHAPSAVLSSSHQMPTEHIDQLALGLAPEEHDDRIMELTKIMQTKGIKNALSVVARLSDPHVSDDFERFLVQFVKAGFPVQGASPKDPVFRALHMTLYEIVLPEPTSEVKEKPFKELVSAMEHFYAGMMSVSGEDEGPDYIALELAVENHSTDFIFYSAVPTRKANLFEKHILAAFPLARIAERKNDYNIFNEHGSACASVASLKHRGVLPIKMYDTLEHDPLHALINAFSKIDRSGEGAAIQIIFRPAKTDYVAKYKKIADELAEGTPLKDILSRPETFGEHAQDMARGFFKELFGTSQSKKKDKKEKEERKIIDQPVLDAVRRKIATPIIEANIRLVASGADARSAEEILIDLESTFHQFTDTHGNGIEFTRLSGAKLTETLRHYSYRLFSAHDVLPLSIRELTSIFHVPSVGRVQAPHLKVATSATAPAPSNLSAEGILLGINKDRGGSVEIRMGAEDRMRHLYVIGQTGTGKTTILKQMIIQDIKNGDGVCFIDPHGSDIQDILANIPPERYRDVIYFDPGYVARPMALNMLEYDVRYPEQKTFVVNEMLSIFNKLFDMKTAGGPMFEQYFRNAALLILDDPSTGSTLVDLSRVLSDKVYRASKLAVCRNPIVVQFWKEVAEKAGGEASLANMVPYITSKFDGFLSNDIMRPIIAQERSSFNFREVMDSRKILLVNLSKGRLGDINSHLIGLILVGKILMAALSRADVLTSPPPGGIAPFYLYIDEFQNVTTDSIATILSEARKYKLSLTIAHQFIGQLDDSIKNAVFGNVGSMSVFRVGSEDAEFLAKQFNPVFSASDLMNVDNYHAFVKMLVLGKPARPFTIETLKVPAGSTQHLDQLKELSYLSYGRERKDVDEEIMKRYIKVAPTQASEQPVK